MCKTLCLLIAFPLLVPAQTPQTTEPTIRTTTSEVLLDFVVRDKHANIIRDLKPGEVQVFEDGVPQTLRHFEFYDGRAGAHGPSAPATAAVTTPVPAAVASVDAPPTVNELRDMSVVSVVIGNIDTRGRALTLKAMREFAQIDLGPNTYVGVFTIGEGGLRNTQAYTNDASKVSAGVERAVKDVSAGSFLPAGGVVEQAQVTPQFAPYGGAKSGSAADPFGGAAWVNEMHDVYLGSMEFLSPLRSLVEVQAKIPGRKVILLFSAGILVHTDSVELLHSVISAANGANVSIYALDTRGITTVRELGDASRRLQEAANASMNMQLAKVNGGDQEVTPDQVIAMEIAETSIHSNTRGNMRELADGTGGALLPDTLNLQQPIREAIESARMHYEAAYAPANTTLDGEFRKIEVRVSRPGATVFARNGYYAVPLVNGRQVYPFEIATLKAINTKPDLRQFDFHATTMEFRPGTVRDQFAFVFQAPTKDLTVTEDKDWAKVHVCVTALIKDSKGQVVDKISKDIPYDLPLAKKADMQKGTVSFIAPFFLAPGHYTVDTAAVDRQSMRASVSRSVLDVEQDSGFSMSDVAVARRVDALNGPGNPYNPLESRGATVTPELAKIVTPDAGGALAFYAVAYPQTPVDAPVNVSLEIYKAGKLVMKSPASPVPPDSTGAASILAKLPAGKLEPGGHYEADELFQYKGERLMKKVDFTLAGEVQSQQAAGR